MSRGFIHERSADERIVGIPRRLDSPVAERRDETPKPVEVCQEIARFVGACSFEHETERVMRFPPPVRVVFLMFWLARRERSAFRGFVSVHGSPRMRWGATSGAMMV